MNKTIKEIMTVVFLGLFVTACGSSSGRTNEKNLTILIFGTGSGTVTSSPGGINCVSDCKELYDDNTAVTLNASPDSGSIFSGFSGDADCADGSVTMSVDITCTATFDRGPTSPATKLFFQSGSISTVDPANPSATPVLVESAATQEAQVIFDGAFDAANQKITDVHARTIIYANIDDGKLYKIDTSTPSVPAQVSNETGGAVFCDPHGAETETDFPDHGKSIYIYQLPGNDGSCFTTDDVWKMVRLNMTASDSPITAKPIVTALNDASTGAIVGFLAFEGQKMVRCDQNFLNCSDVISFTNTAEELVSNFSDDLILQVDDKLFHYKVSTGVLSAPRYTFPGGIPTDISFDDDGTNLYFADGGTVLKLPMDGSANASSFQTEPAGFFIAQIIVTPNNVVYDVVDTTILPIQFTLRVASKTGGVATDLISPTADTLALFEGIAGDLIYYNRIFGNPARVTRGFIKDDGSGGTEIVDAFWAGQTGSTITPDGVVLNKVIWAEGCFGNACPGGGTSGTIKSIDATTQSGELVLGTMPSDIVTVFFFSTFGPGDGILGSGTNDAGFKDILFVDPNRANSLKRITTTPSFSELAIPLAG